MKLFSILNKPVNKADNKQAGIVFLEYVIMAFIITVAVICALWWFYWHLQQMTWEVKQKLDTLKTLTCELPKPYGTSADQPKPVSPGETFNIRDLIEQGEPFQLSASYNYQTVTIHNNSSGQLDGSLEMNGGLPFSIGSGGTWSGSGTTPYGGPPPTPYNTVGWILAAGDLDGTFSVTITPGP